MDVDDPKYFYSSKGFNKKSLISTTLISILKRNSDSSGVERMEGRNNNIPYYKIRHCDSLTLIRKRLTKTVKEPIVTNKISLETSPEENNNEDEICTDEEMQLLELEILAKQYPVDKGIRKPKSRLSKPSDNNWKTESGGRVENKSIGEVHTEHILKSNQTEDDTNTNLETPKFVDVSKKARKEKQPLRNQKNEEKPLQDAYSIILRNLLRLDTFFDDKEKVFKYTNPAPSISISKSKSIKKRKTPQNNQPPKLIQAQKASKIPIQKVSYPLSKSSSPSAKTPMKMKSSTDKNNRAQTVAAINIIQSKYLKQEINTRELITKTSKKRNNIDLRLKLLS